MDRSGFQRQRCPCQKNVEMLTRHICNLDMPVLWCTVLYLVSKWAGSSGAQHSIMVILVPAPCTQSHRPTTAHSLPQQMHTGAQMLHGMNKSRWHRHQQCRTAAICKSANVHHASRMQCSMARLPALKTVCLNTPVCRTHSERLRPG